VEETSTISDDHKLVPEANDFILFSGACMRRIVVGHKEYRSHRHEEVDLVREMEEEILDVAVYAYWMWKRLDVLKKKGGSDVLRAKG